MVVFLDEMNYDKAIPISRFLTRLVEDSKNIVIVICCNEGHEHIDLGLLSRSIMFKFKSCSTNELIAWLFVYANSVNIPITLKQSHLLITCQRPSGIPRESLKNLHFLYGIMPDYYESRLTELFSLKEGDIKELSANYSICENEIITQLELWNSS